MSDYRIGIEGSLKPVALEFFATFSRFEFALKRGGYVQGTAAAAQVPIGSSSPAISATTSSHQ